MAYFNHAFVKSFYTDRLMNNTAKKTQHLAIDGVATSRLGGLFKSTDYSNIDNTTTLNAYAAANSKNKFLIATQSGRGSNLTGAAASTGFQIHGGYDESIKSKDIQMNFINSLGAATSAVGAGQTYEVMAFGGASSTSCWPCGTDPMLRVDLKGSDALRMLGHNAYRQVDIGGVCNCCGDDGDYIHPHKAMAMLAKNLSDDPIISPLINTADTGVGTTAYFATTTDGGSTWTQVALADLDDVVCGATWDANTGAVIRIKPGVVDTQWGNCSWNPTDYTNYEPLLAKAEFLDESGNSCDICKATHHELGATTWNNGAPLTLGQFYYNGDGTTAGALSGVAPAHVVGGGDNVFKDLILSDSYMQNKYSFGAKDSSRFREVEGADTIFAPTLADRHSYMYKMYFLTHSVPRFNNPTGVFDNDQYTYKIYIPERQNIAAGTLIPAGSYAAPNDGTVGGVRPTDGNGGTAADSWDNMWVQIATNSGIAQTTI